MLCQHSAATTLFTKGGRDFLRCRGCGLVWVDPLPTAEELSGYYEGAYGTGSYARFADAVETRRLIAEHRLQLIRPWVQSGPWLDVGCAAGDFIAAAEQAGRSVEGIDASAEAVERARARGLNVRHAGVETFRPEQRYQTVSAFDLIEHLLDPRAFIAGLVDWLSPGGVLILTLPDVRSIYPRLLMGRHWFYYVPEEHFFYFDRNTISRLLESFGFTVLQLSRATKPLSPRYAAAMLDLFNPILGRLSRALVSLLPDTLAERPWKIPIGELLVIAEVRDDER
jgi:SAM-dependent methyltransferase